MSKPGNYLPHPEYNESTSLASHLEEYFRNNGPQATKELVDVMLAKAAELTKQYAQTCTNQANAATAILNEYRNMGADKLPVDDISISAISPTEDGAKKA